MRRNPRALKSPKSVKWEGAAAKTRQGMVARALPTETAAGRLPKRYPELQRGSAALSDTWRWRLCRFRSQNRRMAGIIPLPSHPKSIEGGEYHALSFGHGERMTRREGTSFRALFQKRNSIQVHGNGLLVWRRKRPLAAFTHAHHPS